MKTHGSIPAAFLCAPLLLLAGCAGLADGNPVCVTGHPGANVQLVPMHHCEDPMMGGRKVG